MQALESNRAFYTDDAGYALAKQLDSDLLALAAGFGSGVVGAYSAYEEAYIGTGAAQWDPTASANAGNAAALSDAGIRKAIQLLDDADTPMMGRVLVVPPVAKNTLLGIDRFNSGDYRSDANKGVETGRFGEIYGIQVYTSSNCAYVADTGTATDQRACLLFQKDAMVLVEQMAVRTQTDNKLEHLSMLMVADTIYGVSLYREEAGVALIIPA